MTPQVARVAAALRNAGPRGLTRVDFQLPDAVDGGRPILNFAARILELRERGYDIRKLPDRRDSCDVFYLVSAPGSQADGDTTTCQHPPARQGLDAQSSPACEPGALFELPTEQTRAWHAVFGDDAA